MQRDPEIDSAAGSPGWPIADEDVRLALEAAYADGSWGRYHGPHGGRLAERLAEMHDVDHATLCCSGTIGVELALRGLEVESGHEVVIAGYDFPGNFRAIEAIGATPVLVDIDRDNWCLDPQQLEAACTDATRAIIVSHLHGGLAPMREIVEFAHARGIRVVEDACQAPGAIVERRLAGSWGDAAVLSFGGSKLLTAGRGGAVLTSHADVHQRIKIFAHRGNDAFALSELQAAVLLPQLAKLAERNAIRARAVERLLGRTAKLPLLRPLLNQTQGTPSYYKVAWCYEAAGEVAVARDRLVAHLQAEGVAIDAGFRGFVLRSGRRCRKVGSLDHSRRAADGTLLLHHPVLLDGPAAIDQVAAALDKVTARAAPGAPSAR